MPANPARGDAGVVQLNGEMTTKCVIDSVRSDWKKSLPASNRNTHEGDWVGVVVLLNQNGANGVPFQ